MLAWKYLDANKSKWSRSCHHLVRLSINLEVAKLCHASELTTVTKDKWCKYDWLWMKDSIRDLLTTALNHGILPNWNQIQIGTGNLNHPYSWHAFVWDYMLKVLHVENMLKVDIMSLVFSFRLRIILGKVDILVCTPSFPTTPLSLHFVGLFSVLSTERSNLSSFCWRML